MTDIESLQKKYRFPVQMKDRDEKGTPKHLIEVQEAMYADIKLLRGKNISCQEQKRGQVPFLAL